MKMLIACGLFALLISLAHAGEPRYTCAYFGASYDIPQQHGPIRNQPIGYWLTHALAPAGIVLVNYAVPGADIQDLNEQYNQYLDYANSTERAACIIIGLTGNMIADYDNIKNWAVKVARQERGRSPVIVAISYPRRSMYDQAMLATLGVPPDWDAKATVYDNALISQGARVVYPLWEARTRTLRTYNNGDPVAMYDRFHLSNYSALAAANAIAATIILRFDWLEN